MRISFLIVLIVFCCTCAQAQIPKAGYSFCKVESDTYNRKTTIVVNNGGISNIKKVEPVADSILNKVNTFTNEVAMLNYMNDNGWECFSIISPTERYQTDIYVVYFFRKPKP